MIGSDLELPPGFYSKYILVKDPYEPIECDFLGPKNVAQVASLESASPEVGWK